MNRLTAERSTILRGLVGSTVHGLAVDEGLEDRDEMGVCVEPFDAAMSSISAARENGYGTSPAAASGPRACMRCSSSSDTTKPPPIE